MTVWSIWSQGILQGNRFTSPQQMRNVHIHLSSLCQSSYSILTWISVFLKSCSVKCHVHVCACIVEFWNLHSWNKYSNLRTYDTLKIIKWFNFWSTARLLSPLQRIFMISNRCHQIALLACNQGGNVSFFSLKCYKI